MIETSHNQFHQLLIIGKALEIRGCEVKVLVCNESLKACEIKSIKNSTDRDVCWNCRFNLKNIVPLYKLKIFDIKSICNQKEIHNFAKIIEEGDLKYNNLQGKLPFYLSKK